MNFTFIWLKLKLSIAWFINGIVSKFIVIQNLKNTQVRSKKAANIVLQEKNTTPEIL
jgi:hypothetical protein